jgi:predicted DNA binding CopG/RHH family protein
MPEGFQVDLDGEQVLFDGTWYAKEDLAQKIRGMVDGGDYRVSRPSAALEALENALSGLRSLTLRLPVEHAEALAAEAARQGLPVGAFTRELLMRALSMPGGMEPSAAPSAFQGGPVAAANAAPSPVEAAGAIQLTPKRRQEDQVENDWFKRR